MSEFSKFDLQIFKQARKVAETSDFPHFHVGCVIVYKHSIIGMGSNSKKTHPQQKYYNCRYRHFHGRDGKPCVHSVHAEIAALSSISYTTAMNINWRDVKVYIYRISNGRPTGRGLSAPCPSCRNALLDKGIRHFYYTGNDSYIYERVD